MYANRPSSFLDLQNMVVIKLVDFPLMTLFFKLLLTSEIELK